MSEVERPDRIDDLIVLGRSHPEPIRDGRHTVCLGGYSPTHGYVRLYPTRMRMGELKRWNIVSVPVEWDAEDNRDESYKIAGSREDWDSLHEKIEKVGELNYGERYKLMQELATDCRERLNNNKQSLGLVTPKEIRDAYLDPTETETIQTDLTGNKLIGKNEFDHKLYVDYECVNCTQKTGHSQHVIEWGVYQYWKNYDDPEGVIDALHLKDDDYEKFFFLGNLRHQRTAYVIISITRFKKDKLLRHGVKPEGQSGIGDWE